MTHWAFLLLLACAPDGAPRDAAVDGTACRSARDCSDGLFCDGLEVCSPGAPGADERGCVDGTPPCGEARCSELGEGCEGCAPADADGDGHDALACGGDDCDDSDAERAPDLSEVCDLDGRDEDCDAETLGDTDLDGDAHVDAACCNGARCGDDCDDSTASIAPGVPERCDGRDQDCDGSTDEGIATELYEDRDGDGFGSGAPRLLCEPIEPFTALRAGDCDDDDDATHPLAGERCDGRDEDCSGVADDGAATAGCFGVEVVDAACVDGGCVIGGCSPGFDDCNGDPIDGCEQSLATITDCGECGRRCEDPHGTAACIGGVCDVIDCTPSFHRCGTRCVHEDATSCGESCTVCATLEHGRAACSNTPVPGSCRYACDSQYLLDETSEVRRCLWRFTGLAALEVDVATLLHVTSTSVEAWYGWVPGDNVSARVRVTMPSGFVGTLSVNGMPLTPGVPSAPLPLERGENRLLITVAAESGDRRVHELLLTRGWDDWHYLKSDVPSASASLGAAVAASDTWLVAGAPDDDLAGTDAGRALVYAPTATGFRFVQALTAPNAGAGDRFGASVAVSGDVIVVGAPGEASLGSPDDDSAPRAGAAYVFRWSGTAFVFESYVKASAPVSGAAFGTAVGIDAATLAVIAPGELVGPGDDPDRRGIAYVLERTGSWAHVARRAVGGSAFVRSSVAVDGDCVAVGVGDGAVVLERAADWASTPLPSGGRYAFGRSIAVEGDTIVVGAGGAAIVFERTATWTEAVELTAPAADLGTSVAIGPGGILVGAATDSSSGRGAGGWTGYGSSARESGAAHLFVREGATYRRHVYLKAPNADGGDRFGTSVAWCAGRAVIGAPGEDGVALGIDGPMGSEGSMDAGAIYTVAP